MFKNVKPTAKTYRFIASFGGQKLIQKEILVSSVRNASTEMNQKK